MHKNEVCFFPHSVITVGQNREAYQRGERNSNGITQPSGAATPRSSDAHKRITVPKAFCVLWEYIRPRPKRGKVRRSDTRPGEVCERAERSEGVIPPPSETPRVSPCKPLCAILLAKASVYPLSPVKTNVSRLCEYDLEPLWKGLSPCRMGRTFSVFRTDQAVIGGKQGSRRSPAKRVRWEEETQRNE